MILASRKGAAVVSLCAALTGQGSAATAASCTRCGWTPPKTRKTVTVRSVNDLISTVASVAPSTTILLADGEYRLPHMLDIGVPGTVLRSRSGDRAKVIIRGGGMIDDPVGVALSVSAAEVTIADLSVGDVRYHGVQVRGETGATGVMIHNVRVFDTGQQLVKITTGRDRWADDGQLACSLLEYSDHAPSDYTSGINGLAVKGWVVRDNRFVRIRGPREIGWRAGPAVLFWGHSIGTVVERNVVIDSFRGIALGLLAAANPDYRRPGDGRFDHHGGIVRNNVVCNLNSWGDEGIEVNSGSDVQIDHNTVFVEGSLAWSISVRYPGSSGWVRNNLTSRGTIFRDGGAAGLAGNLSDARREWFASPASCDLRLADPGLPPSRAGAPLASVADDFERRPRPPDAPDAGAFQYAGVSR